jgi:hypothetical protein
MAVTLNASTSSGFIQTADTSGDLALQSNGTTQLTVSSTGAYGQLKASTVVTPTSGTSVDFTGLPTWVRRVTVMLAGVTISTTSPIIIQIGAGSFASTLYSGTAGGVGNSGNVMTVTSYTNGFGMAGAMSSADQKYNGNLLICLVDSATGLWAASGSTSLAPGSFTGVQTCGGSRTLSGTLDRVRITTAGGAATFTAGSINILYEG